MKGKDLRARTDEHLKELEKSLANDVFQARFKNYTNRLNDTATIKKARRDLARVKTILTERTSGEHSEPRGEAEGRAKKKTAAKGEE